MVFTATLPFAKRIKELTWDLFNFLIGFLAPKGVLRISSDDDDGRIFLGLKFSIPGFVLGRKIWLVLFVWLDLSGDLSRDFLSIQNNLKICGSAYVSQP